MRIAVDARPYFMRTGIARYTRAMLRELTAAAPEHEWLLLISDHHVPEDVPLRGSRLTIQVSSAPWLGGSRERRQLEAEAGAWGADAFYSIFPPIALRGIPTVVTVFDLIPCTHPDLLPPRVVRAIRSALARAIPGAARVVAISDSTAAAVRQAFPARGTDVLAGTCGVSSEVVAHADTSARRDGVLFVGTIEPRKNVPLVVEAARLLPEVSFTLAGKAGWGTYDLAAEIAGLPNVIWHGRVDDAQLRELYARAAIFVYPSTVEGFGLPVLEAIQGGALPLVSQDPALREVAPDPRLAVPPGSPRALAEAITRWLGDDDERQRVLNALREHAKRYTWAAGADVALRALEDAAGRGEAPKSALRSRTSP